MNIKISSKNNKPSGKRVFRNLKAISNKIDDKSKRVNRVYHVGILYFYMYIKNYKLKRVNELWLII